MTKPVHFLASAIALCMASLPALAAEPEGVIRTVQPRRNFGALPPPDASTFDLVRGDYPTSTEDTVTEIYDDPVALDPRSYSGLAEMEAAADAEMAALSYVGHGGPYRPWVYRPSYAYRYGLYPYRAYGAPYYGWYGPRAPLYGWGYGPRYSFRYDVWSSPLRGLYGPSYGGPSYSGPAYGAARWDRGVIGYTHPLHYRGYEGCLYW